MEISSRRCLAVLSLVVLAAFLGAVPVQAACPSFAYCTAYAAGTVVTYNGSNYTASYAIDSTRDCSAYTPATDNWWSPGGTCGSATATYTATATSGATATRTPTPTATSSGGGATLNTTNWYKIINKNSNKCVDAAAAGTANGTVVQQYTCNGTNAQVWQFENGSVSGYYRVKAYNATGQVFDITGGTSATGDGVKLELWGDGSQANKEFQAISEGSGYYHFIARHSGKCLDINGASTADSVQLQQWTCNGTVAQSFSLSATTAATPTPTPSGGTGVGAVVSSSQFDQMFPPSGRAAAYNYTGFVSGGNAASGFCTTGDTAMEARECAAFFANSAVETGQGQYIEEINKYGPAGNSCYCQGGGACGVGCDGSNSGTCTANANSWYYGRGWLQISWDFNYCAAGSYIGVSLINNAQVLTNDAAKTTTASLWYWMTQSGGNNQSPHSCIINNVGFGCTIKSINGGLECPSMGGGNTASRDSRINFFNQFLGVLGSTAVGSSSC